MYRVYYNTPSPTQFYKKKSAKSYSTKVNEMPFFHHRQKKKKCNVVLWTSGCNAMRNKSGLLFQN